jgi:hypothetical protein
MQIDIKKIIIGNLWWVIPFCLIIIALKLKIVDTIFSVKLVSIGYLIISIGFFQSGFYNLSQFNKGNNKGINLMWMIVLFGFGGINIIIIFFDILAQLICH